MFIHVIFKSRHLNCNAIDPFLGLLMHNEHAALVEVLLLQRLVEIIIYILGGPASHLCAQ